MAATEILTQREAVFRAVTSCKDETGHFDRKEVVEVLMGMYANGEFEIKANSQKESDKSQRAYMGSVLSNWLKKDPRLSGSPCSSERKARRPADDEMKRLTLAKVILMNEGQSTEEIDLLIKQRQDEILAARSRRQEILELTQ